MLGRLGFANNGDDKMKTKVRIYANKRNPHKFIEVHSDGHYHNSVKQYMLWTTNIFTGKKLEKPVKDLLGDRKLHRWRKANLKELLEDYELWRIL